MASDWALTKAADYLVRDNFPSGCEPHLERLAVLLDEACAEERAKWARILRESAVTMRRWATELRAEGDDGAREVADVFERDATEWQCVADLIEDNNENPCRETSSSG